MPKLTHDYKSLFVEFKGVETCRSVTSVYGAKFKDFYVQNIINVKDSYRKEIVPGTSTIICGFASHEHATSGLAQPMIMQGERKTPYNVSRTPITNLRPMSEFPNFLRELLAAKNLKVDF